MDILDTSSPEREREREREAGLPAVARDVNPVNSYSLSLGVYLFYVATRIDVQKVG